MQALTTWHGNVAPVLASGKMAERRRATQKLATAAANKTKPARASSIYFKADMCCTQNYCQLQAKRTSSAHGLDE